MTQTPTVVDQAQGASMKPSHVQTDRAKRQRWRQGYDLCLTDTSRRQATHSEGLKSTQEAGPGIALTWFELQWGTGHMDRGQSAGTASVMGHVRLYKRWHEY